MNKEKEMFNAFGKNRLRELILNKIVMCPEIDCWIWIGARKANGRGFFMFRRKNIFSSRMSFLAFKGNIPIGMCVLHECDIPMCVNPSHLFLGTKKQNTQDAMNKGRMRCPKGEHCRKSKLKTKEIIEIIKLRNSGKTYPFIGNKFGVTGATIRAVISGRTWAHVEGRPQCKKAYYSNAKDFRCGSGIASSKLDERDVVRIISMRNHGLSTKAIAKRFNVSQDAIIAIFSGKTWRHVSHFTPLKYEPCSNLLNRTD